MLRPDEILIFDCDGVLVDSEPLTMRVLSEMVRGLGAPEAYRRFRGRKIADCIRELEVERGTTFPAGFIEAFRGRCAELYREELTCDPDLRRVVEGLGGRYCVGTSAPLEKVELMLCAVGVWDLFEGRIFSAYALNTWKPDPTLFLAAARHWGVDPASCLVVEDSPTGVQAARNAAMDVVVLDPRGEAIGPEFVGATRIKTIGELPDRIAEWQRTTRLFKSDGARSVA